MRQFTAKSVWRRFEQQKLPVKYLHASDDKEQVARSYATERGITVGDVCALTCLEMAPTFRRQGTNMVVQSHPV